MRTEMVKKHSPAWWQGNYSPCNMYIAMEVSLTRYHVKRSGRRKKESLKNIKEDKEAK